MGQVGQNSTLLRKAGGDLVPQCGGLAPAALSLGSVLKGSPVSASS